MLGALLDKKDSGSESGDLLYCWYFSGSVYCVPGDDLGASLSCRAVEAREEFRGLNSEGGVEMSRDDEAGECCAESDLVLSIEPSFSS